MAETKNVFKKRPSAAASRKKLMGTLEKERTKNAATRAVNEKARAKAAKPSSGTMADKIKGQRTADGRPKVSPGRYEPLRTKGPLKDASEAGKPSVARAIASGAGRIIGRSAGPVAALVSMTSPAGAPEESATIRRDRSYGPLMRGNSTRVNQYGKGDAETGTFNKAVAKPVKPKLRPDMSPPRPVTSPAQKVAQKSDIRVAFEKEFAKNRAAGKKVFKFRGQDYSTKVK